ncbi:luciferase domain-containing protein [Streptacidiphilus anmyonensis]|uniref:luciferase domain-containing protein n=1 Tax=Streptacidiphilus anmyonensis TaxID=405782 RepID=UPI0007C7F05C|nr:luciferase family protein [Streptacidiphilus anmyonensis]
MSAAERAREQLVGWPDLTLGQSSCGVGTSLSSGGREIVHFHTGPQTDVQLTPAAIARLDERLRESTAVRLHADSGWVTVLVECDTDIDLLSTLVSVALQANAAQHPTLVPTPCNFQRTTILRPEGQQRASEPRRLLDGLRRRGLIRPHHAA